MERRIGRPDVARDVLEALMVQRGLRRRFDPLVEREARNAEPDGDGRADFRDLTTFTIDPPTARDFDDAISAEELRRRRDPRVGAHRRRRGLRAARLLARPRGVPARELGLRARPGRADAARGALEPGVLAGARRGPPDGDRRARVRGREGPPHGLPPLGHPLRRAARLPARGPHLRGRRAGRGAGAQPLAAARKVAAALADAREQRGALAVESTEPEFGFSRDGHVESLLPSRADRVAPADRVPDDRRQRGRRRAAGGAQAAGAVPRARAARPAARASGCSPAGGARRADAARARDT